MSKAVLTSRVPLMVVSSIRNISSACLPTLQTHPMIPMHSVFSVSHNLTRSPTLPLVRTSRQRLPGMFLLSSLSHFNPFIAMDTDILLCAASNSSSGQSMPPFQSRSRPGTSSTPSARSQCTMPHSQVGGNGPWTSF